jgi:hypothetical protein
MLFQLPDDGRDSSSCVAALGLRTRNEAQFGSEISTTPGKQRDINDESFFRESAPD